MAKVLVNASGWKSFPSSPVSENTGRNARMMIAIEKKIGLPIWWDASRTASSSGRRRPFLLVELEAAEAVLGDDDPGVHQDADGDRDPHQRHDVGRDAEGPHQQERDQDGDRERRRDDQDRAEVRQEEHVGEDDQQRLLDQRAAQRAHGAVDQTRAIVEGDDAHSRREPALDLRDLRLDAPEDLRRALAVADRHHAAHHLAAVLLQRAAAEGRAQLDGAELREVDRRAGRRADRDALDVGHGLDQADAAHHVLHAVLLDDLAADVAVGALDRLEHLTQRHAMGIELSRVEVHLVLAHEAADRGHLRDARAPR